MICKEKNSHFVSIFHLIMPFDEQKFLVLIKSN